MAAKICSHILLGYQMFKFSTKARTLLDVSLRLSVFKVPNFIIFSTEEYQLSPSNVIDQIRTKFYGGKIAIRSSSEDEDGSTLSMAGKYKSILNIDPNNSFDVTHAISDVIGSYGSSVNNTEFIVQDMISDICMSGVIFTHDLNNGAPYYVINYDDETGRTDTVTSGEGNYSNRTIYIFRGKENSIRSERFKRVIEAVQELERVTNHNLLDIEFALTNDLIPVLFQVRKITTYANWNRELSKRIESSLDGINQYIIDRSKPLRGVYGNKTVFGQMPDWNPAEMIGRAPRALAFSLYKKLITDHTWRIARKNMGYFSPSCQKLMISLAGQPYIDVRLSLNSFLPDKLPANICTKLVDHWVDKLISHPELHDKIEFDVAITCYTFDFDDKFKKLAGGILTSEEEQVYKLSVLSHTKYLVENYKDGALGNALKAVDILKLNYFTTKALTINDLPQLLEDCINFGTIQFAIIARHAFIAKGLIDSLVATKVMNQSEVDGINQNIDTISRTFVEDVVKLKLGSITKTEFMNNYGHLRPGTYDILSEKYESLDDSIFSGTTNQNIISNKNKYESTQQLIDKITDLLIRNEFIEIDGAGILEFYKESTAGREYAKFIFTKLVSLALDLIVEFGEKVGLTREEMSNISLDDIVYCMDFSCDENIEDFLRKIASRNREKHRITSAIRLPQILTSDQIFVIPFQISQPNFITLKKVEGSVILINKADDIDNINGKIVAIENADPGFDWIFSQRILGLVTKYGGANSHMAIRCAEFSIPAAIGCGEQKFERILHLKKIAIDCGSGSINEIH